MTDACFRSAGYALMIEDNPDQGIPSKRKTYAPWRWAQKFFFLSATQNVHILRRIFTIYMELLEFAHIFWETTKPTIVLTDNKSLPGFFETKAILPAL